MLKIGDFARLSQVSIVTLRHYDELGLLKPVTVDSFTGYRYYSINQLARLNRILALKDLGFSLEQIESVLSGITLEQLQGMLKMKQAEAQQRLEEEQDRLKRIAARLHQIEMENRMAEFDVVLKTVPPFLIAACHIVIPTNDQAGHYLGMAYGAVWEYIKQNNLKPLGSNLALWHQSSEILENEEAEAAVPVDRLTASTDKIKVYELPTTQVVSVVHHGAFEGFVQCHTVLHKWIEANDYEVVGAYRELYLKHDPNDLDDTTTEIQYPVRKN